MTLQALHPPGIESQLFVQESFVEHSSAVVLTSPTIRTINALQTELAERLDESGNVQIDGTAVDRIDTAGLQLLAAFVRDLRAEQRAVEWVGCSDALRKAATALGLEAALCLPGIVVLGGTKN
jgi:phospholipid transport system transporter-binding protein